MKKMTYFVMALALVLGLAQCKKEQIEPQNEGNSVMITLDVDGGNGNGSRAEVVPPHVYFKDGDQILVAYDGQYVGTLEKTTEGGVSKFRGSVTITENVEQPQPLYFYFLGNNQGELETGATTCTVNIIDQTKVNDMPVISMGKSTKNFPTSDNTYSSRLYNKASLMMFNVTTDSKAVICIKGLNNQVTVDFENKTFDYSQVNDGLIKMSAVNNSGETWAIVLPQDAWTEGSAGTVYTEDGIYTGARPAIDDDIAENQYLDGGVDITLDYTEYGTPLTLEATTAGTIQVQNPQSGMQYKLNNGAKTTMTETTTIVVAVGDKVRFYGDGTNITSYYFDEGTRTRIASGTANVKAYGNIMSLVDETGYATATTLTGDNNFNSFFWQNTTLTDASGILLPATTLTYRCYFAMFEDCSNLTAAPALPAMTMADECYRQMFYNCSNLTTVPLTLPATELATTCYAMMFVNCSSLTTAPTLPAATLVTNCYRQMFDKCSNLNYVTCLATSGIGENYSTLYWLRGVATPGTFTAANSSVSWPVGEDYYYGGIPSGWTRLNAQ